MIGLVGSVPRLGKPRVAMQHPIAYAVLSGAAHSRSRISTDIDAITKRPFSRAFVEEAG
jgi:hypothetical protein